MTDQASAAGPTTMTVDGLRKALEGAEGDRIVKIFVIGAEGLVINVSNAYATVAGFAVIAEKEDPGELVKTGGDRHAK